MLPLLTPEHNHTEDLLTRQNVVILISSIMIAVLYDILFFEKSAGVSYPLFVCLLYAILYGNIKKLIVKKWCFGWFLSLPIVALSMTYLLFSNDVLRILNSLFIPIIFIAHLILISGNNRYEWFHWGFAKDILLGLVYRPLKYTRKLWLLILAFIQEGNESTKHAVLKKVIVGMLLSSPVLIIVIMLLSSADLVFQNLVYEVLANIRLDEIINHTLLIGFIVIISFSYLWGLFHTRTVQITDPDAPKKLDEVMILTGLFLLNAVYVLFSWIQFSYFFGSIYNFLPEGLTYAEYARRGFGELIIVVLINTGIVLGGLNFTNITGVLSSRIFKGLNSALLISTFISLFSAHSRMALYEEAYGYTYLRVFPHAFMVMIFCMLSVTLYRVWSDRINLAKWYITIGLVAYVLINYLNVDVLIAEKNMERYYKTGSIDVHYLASMSYDTLPYLEKLAKDQNQYIAAEAKQLIEQKRKVLSINGKWQSYNVSQQQAKKFLVENLLQ